MTLRTIQWIADSGLLVGLTTIGEFDLPTVLANLAFSSTTLTAGVAACGAVLGTAAGSVVTAASLPVGLTINAGPGWAYDGTGVAGSYSFQLTETLPGAANSPRVTSITVSLADPGSALDFTQSSDSSLIAALRSF